MHAFDQFPFLNKDTSYIDSRTILTTLPTELCLQGTTIGPQYINMDERNILQLIMKLGCSLRDSKGPFRST